MSKTQDSSAPLRFYEAWTVEPDGEGGREITDECGHVHDTLAEAREHHALNRQYNAIVALDCAEDGSLSVAREYRHAPKRPRGGWNRFIFDMVNRLAEVSS